MEASTLIPVAEAAGMVGKSRMALMKAIAKGKISASRDVHGRWQIDPAELTRVYRVIATANSNQPLEMADGSSMIAEVLQVRLAAMEARCAEQATTIDDLRTQRDQEQAERKQAQTQLMALLSGPKKPSGFWDRLIGKSSG